MKTVSILRPATWVGVIPLVLGMQTALAEALVYVPLGGEGTRHSSPCRTPAG